MVLEGIIRAGLTWIFSLKQILLAGALRSTRTVGRIGRSRNCQARIRHLAFSHRCVGPVPFSTSPPPPSFFFLFLLHLSYSSPQTTPSMTSTNTQTSTHTQPTVIALVLTITNTLAFSRCDRFSQASNLASTAMYGSGIARSLAGGMFGRLFNR